MSTNIALITGAGGLVGSEASRFFADKGFDIIGIDNNMRAKFFGEQASTSPTISKLVADLNSKFIYSNTDIRYYESLENIFEQYKDRIKIIIHCAAQPSHDWAAKEPITDFEINAVGTLNLLELTRQYCPDAAFLFMSTNKIFGDRPNLFGYKEIDTRYVPDNYHPWPNGFPEILPIDNSIHSIFGASKLAADIMTQEYGKYFGIKTVVFRGGCLTGPAHMGTEQHGFLSYLVKQIVNHQTYNIYGYKGKQVRDNIHSYDLVNAFWHYYQNPRPGEAYNIGGGINNSCSIIEAADIISKVTNKPFYSNYIDTPRKGDHQWWITNLDKFQSDYPEWTQKYTLEDTIKEIIDANKEIIHA